MRTSRTVITTLLALALSGVLALFLAGPASAQTSPCPPGQPFGRQPGTPPNAPPQNPGRNDAYPPGRCALALSQSAAARGQTVGVRGEGFVPGETVALSIGSRQVATAIADPSGVIVADITVPNDAAIGRTEVTASGQSQVLSAAFEVTAAPAADRARATATAAAAAGSVARTGAAIAGMTALGAVLVTTGAVFVLGARRRRTLPAA